MRLVQFSDAAWHGEPGLPATTVQLAVNRKKVAVMDKNGELRKAMGDNLYQILECVSGWSYRSFAAQLNIQSVASVAGKSKDHLPSPQLQFKAQDIARACNDFYRPILDAELVVLRDRGYVDEDWERNIRELLDCAQDQIKQQRTFLLRVGRHSGAESMTLTDEVASKAITLVRNDGGLLPLEKNSKVAVLGISNGFDGGAVMGSLVSTLRNGGLRITSAYLQENSTSEQTAAARKAVSEADVVVVGLYGRVRSGARNSVGIPENGAEILREALAANKKILGVSFGNPYILGAFPDLKTYLVAYGDMASLQRAVGRSLLGTQDITGRLPISLPGLHPRGTGIQLIRK